MRLRRLFVASMLLWCTVGLVPADAAKPGSGSCQLPASDLCTDYRTRGYKWAAMPIPYYVNPQHAPIGTEQDVQDAFLAWENEVKSPAVEAAYPGDGSSVDFVFMGVTTATGARDGINVVHFTPCAQCGAAYVETLHVRRGKIYEFDVHMNGARSWFTDLSCPAHDCGALDLQGVAAHEIGHVLDLYHVTDEAAAALTMAPGAVPNDISKRDLGAGDVLGIRKLYPN